MDRNGGHRGGEKGKERYNVTGEISGQFVRRGEEELKRNRLSQGEVGGTRGESPEEKINKVWRLR